MSPAQELAQVDARAEELRRTRALKVRSFLQRAEDIKKRIDQTKEETVRLNKELEEVNHNLREELQHGGTSIYGSTIIELGPQRGIHIKQGTTIPLL